MLNITRLRSQAISGVHSRITRHPHSLPRSYSNSRNASSVTGRAATRLMVTAADKQTVRLLSPLLSFALAWWCEVHRHAPTPLLLQPQFVTTACQVLVTGAGGRTGKLVLQKLLGRPEHFEARGLVRTAEVGLSITTLAGSAYTSALAAGAPFPPVCCRHRRLWERPCLPCSMLLL